MKVPFSVAVAFATSYCIANPIYHVQRMPIDPVTGTQFQGLPINNHGWVAGNAASADQTDYNPGIWKGGSLIDHIPTSVQTSPAVLNDVGEVAGWTFERLGNYQGAGFRWDPVNGFRFLPWRFSGTSGFQMPYAINNSGTIIGEYYDVNGYPHRGIYWDANNVVHDLPYQDNGGLLIPYDINDAGRIVGWNFYLDPDGSIHSPTGVNTDYNRVIRAVNSTGMMVGDSDSIGSINRTYIWNADGSVFARFDSTSSLIVASEYMDINDSLEVCTTTKSLPDFVNHGMYFSPLTGLMALDSLLDSESISAGWHIRATYSINNRGQIIAFASTGTTMESNYTGEVVLLNPVPEPGSLAVLALGAAALLRRRKKN